MAENSKQFRVRAKGFSEMFSSEEKALAAFETQKSKLIRKKESFTIQLFARETVTSEWILIDEVKRSASFYNED